MRCLFLQDQKSAVLIVRGDEFVNDKLEAFKYGENESSASSSTLSPLTQAILFTFALLGFHR
jgi:hypothetical protein